MSAPWSLGVALTRAAAILFGSTAVAYWLVRGVAQGPAGAGSDLQAYGPWLADALTPDAAVADSLGRSVVLGGVGIGIGVGLGLAMSQVLRIRRADRLLGFVAAPGMALALPGTLVFALLWLTTEAGLLPMDAVIPGGPAETSISFLAAAGTAVGLAVAPGVTALLAADSATRGTRAFGLAVARGLLAARPGGHRLAAFATTPFLLALATAEILSGYDGLFWRFATSLQNGATVDALDVVPVVAVVGILVALLLDLGPLLLGPRPHHPEPVSTRLADSAWPLLTMLGSASLIAAVGYLLVDLDESAEGPVAAIDPTFGGPWLGTDTTGRSVVELVTVALGPTLVAAVLAAAPAMAIGILVATAFRSLPLTLQQILGAFVDLAWWPLVLLVPLAVLNDSGGGSEASSVVILVTALGLSPMATRLAITALDMTDERIRSLVSAGLLLAALAMTVRIVTGLMGVTVSDRGPGTADLGALMASGIAGFGSGPWTFLVPALSTVAVMATGLGLASAVVDRVPVAALQRVDMDPTPMEVLATTTIELGGRSAQDRATRQGPLHPQELRSVTRAVNPEYTDPTVVDAFQPEPPPTKPALAEPPDVEPRQTEPEPEPATGPAAAETVEDSEVTEAPEKAETVAVTEIIDAVKPAQEWEVVDTVGTAAVVDVVEASEPVIDLRQDDSDDHGEDNLEGDADAAQHESVQEPEHEPAAENPPADDVPFDIEAEATKTIELRPATLRRAGVEPPQETHPPSLAEDAAAPTVDE